MRTFQFFTGQDASEAATSPALMIDKRVIWKLIVVPTGFDGILKLKIQEAFNGGGVLPEPSDWYDIPSGCDNDNISYDIDQETIIESERLVGSWIRVVLDPNTNTSGTVSVKLAYKTYP